MSPTPLTSGRRRPPRKRSRVPLGQVLAAAPAGSAPALAYPGYSEPDPDEGHRTLVSSGLAALLHGGALLMLLVVASQAPVVEELIPVRILQEEPPPPPPEEPAPAPKALAERRALPFAPAVQAVQPQIVNPRVIARSVPRVEAQALEMAAVDASAAPTEVATRDLPVVERVSAVSSSARARVGPVDLSQVRSRAVRGPTQVEARVGPSVGPRRVEAADVGDSFGTAPLQVGSGNGSSVREGILSDRDVVGAPDGALVVSVDTSLGDSPYGGTGGSGTGGAAADEDRLASACVQRAAVQSYISGVKQRMYERWVLPPGVDLDRKVTLRFRLDVAGSPSQVELVRAEDNALGASAIDALRSAAPFPPIPEEARCLAQRALVGTFANPLDG